MFWLCLSHKRFWKPAWIFERMNKVSVLLSWPWFSRQKTEHCFSLLSLPALLFYVKPPSHPHPLPLALVVRHVRGIPGHSCHVKGMFTDDWGLESVFCLVFFCTKHLNMHHSLLTLNHEVGLEMNLALRSRSHAHTYARVRESARTHAYVSTSVYISVWANGKLERSGTAGARDSQAGRP